MYYKRNEPFRYAFNAPIEGTLLLSNREDQKHVNILILDISLNGVKIESNIKLDMNEEVFLSFCLLDKECSKRGNIVWKKDYHNKYQYGIQLEEDRVYQEQVTSLLKQLVKLKEK